MLNRYSNNDSNDNGDTLVMLQLLISGQFVTTQMQLKLYFLINNIKLRHLR